MKMTRIYKELHMYADADEIARDLIFLVDEVFEECRQIHKTVLRHMPEYTLHDEEHLLRTVELMDRLLPTATLQNLIPLELAGLILSAILHDIGMAPSENEIRRLLSESPSGINEDSSRLRYGSFREGYTAILRRQDELRSKNRYFEAQELEAYLLSEYLRQTHGDRGKHFIFDQYHKNFIYAGFNFASRLAEVCYSHAQDPLFLEQIPCWELVRPPGEYVNWRFMAVLLRLADILDFDGKRTPAILFEHLGIRDKVSLTEWKKHRSIRAWDIRPGRIAFSARCPDPIIEKCVRDFIQVIERELSFTRGILGGMHDSACLDMRERYYLELPPSVDLRDVGPEDGPDGPIYKFVDLGFHLDEENIISLVMGMNLYGNRLLFLRELLQNAVDTCRHKQALHKGIPNAPEYAPKITVELYEENGKWFLAVEDNGMGMDEEIVNKYFARIGKSYYRSGRFLQERAETHLNFQPISIFGIGVLSAFMVTDHLRVETRKLRNLYDLDLPIDIEIHGPTGLFWFRKSERKEPGTRLVLTLKEDPSFLRSKPEHISEVYNAAWEKDKLSFKETIKQLAPHVEFPITVYEDGKTYRVKETWKLPELSKQRSTLNLRRQVVIDLTSEGPDGLDGLVRILLLQDYQGKLSEVVELEEDSFYCSALSETLYDKLEQRFGYIEHIYVDYSEKEGKTQGYSTESYSVGRWSQQGFRVPYPLFVEHEKWLKSGEPSTPIDYPFVVHYDLNLSGDFTVNLTADRLRIVPDEKFEDVKRRICEVMSTLLLKNLGKREVRRSRDLLQNVLKKGDDTGKRVFEICLQRMLSE
jgi:hypothetical protein